VAIAMRFVRVGQYTAAIEPLLDAYKSSPDDATVLSAIGVAYLHAQRLDDAITWLRRSIAIQPGSSSTHHHLGMALQRSGDDEAALVEYRLAVAHSSSATDSYAQLGDLLWNTGRQSEAIDSCQRIAALAAGSAIGGLSKTRSS
jgi:Flp pilus assembly protein TadD